MAPKATGMAEDQFLAACFKHCIDKPRVDFNQLALAVGMSSGGAANKFRAILKKFEEKGDVSWAQDSDLGQNGSELKTPTPIKRKSTIKKNANTIIGKKNKNRTSDDDDDSDAKDDLPPAKKAKSQSKGLGIGQVVGNNSINLDDGENEQKYTKMSDTDGASSEESEEKSI